MIERNNGKVKLTFSNDYSVILDFTSRNASQPNTYRDLVVLVEVEAPGALGTPAYYSASNLVDLLKRVSDINGFTDADLAAMQQVRNS